MTMDNSKFSLITANDFNEICRFCLEKTISLIPIFKNELSTTSTSNLANLLNSNDDTDGNDKNILNQINLCIGLNISQFDGMPIFMCRNCENKLLASYTFRQQCHTSAQILWDAYQNQDNFKSNENDDDGSNFYGNCQQDSNDDEDHKINTLDINKDPPLTHVVPNNTAFSKTELESNHKMNFKAKVKKEINTNVNNLEENCAIATRTVRRKRGKYKKSLKGDKKKRIKNPIVQCQICGIFQTNLTFHMIKHTGICKYECDFCGRSFSQKNNMYQHMRNRHIKEKIRTFTCDQCPQAFFRKHLLERHMTTHTNVKPYKCDLCNRKFRINCDLQRHILIHTQDRRFKCEDCGKMFLSRGGLKNHRGVHTSERPFECGLCSMAFTTSSGASVHRKIHLDGDAYKCNLCGCRMKTWRMLKPHFEAHKVEGLNK